MIAGSTPLAVSPRPIGVEPRWGVDTWPMMPSIGRIVIYHAYGSVGGKYKSVPRAAIVTAVPDNPDGTPGDGTILSLMVCNPTGVFFDIAVPVAPTAMPGHWTWPERV